MILKNSFNYINQFFFFFANKTRNFYLNSIIYNNKISKIENRNLEFKPSPGLIDCIIKYKKKKNKIEDFYLSSIWKNENITKKDYEKLHNFFWLFTLDLKNSFTEWYDVSEHTDKDLSDLIYSKKIYYLIDLAGYSNTRPNCHSLSWANLAGNRRLLVRR